MDLHGFFSSPRRVRSVGEKCPGGFGCLAGKPPGWTGTLIAVDWQGVSIRFPWGWRVGSYPKECMKTATPSPPRKLV